MDRKRSPINNTHALSRLVALTISLLVGSWLFKQAFPQGSIQGFPLAAAEVIVVATAAFLLGLQERDDDLLETETPNPAISRSRSQRLSSWRRYLRLIALFLALLFIAFTLCQIPNLNLPDYNFRAVFITWLIAFCFFLLAIAPPLNLGDGGWTTWRRTHLVSTIAVGVVMLLALVLRLWQIDTVPYTLAGDEASQGLEAFRVLAGEIRNPFSTGWLGVPTKSFFLNSLTINWLDQTIIGLRLPWALVGTTTVLATFFLVKQLKGTQMAFIVALLVATYHYHIQFSRLGSNQVADPFFITLALLFFIPGLG